MTRPLLFALVVLAVGLDVVFDAGLDVALAQANPIHSLIWDRYIRDKQREYAKIYRRSFYRNEVEDEDASYYPPKGDFVHEKIGIPDYWPVDIDGDMMYFRSRPEEDSDGDDLIEEYVQMPQDENRSPSDFVDEDLIAILEYWPEDENRKIIPVPYPPEPEYDVGSHNYEPIWLPRPRADSGFGEDEYGAPESYDDHSQ